MLCNTPTFEYQGSIPVLDFRFLPTKVLGHSSNSSTNWVSPNHSTWKIWVEVLELTLGLLSLSLSKKKKITKISLNKANFQRTAQYGKISHKSMLRIKGSHISGNQSHKRLSKKTSETEGHGGKCKVEPPRLTVMASHMGCRLPSTTVSLDA